jgi:hypothetical protein
VLFGEVLDSLPGILTVTFLFGGGIIVTIITTLSNNWRKVQESEHLATLKQSMVERGMSADEIERVLRAGPANENEVDDTTALSTKLVEHNVQTKDMEQILNVFCAADAGTRITLARSVVAMLDNGAQSDQVLVAVRALSRQAPAEQPHPQRFPDSATSFRS